MLRYHLLQPRARQSLPRIAHTPTDPEHWSLLTHRRLTHGRSLRLDKNGSLRPLASTVAWISDHLRLTRARRERLPPKRG